MISRGPQIASPTEIQNFLGEAPHTPLTKGLSYSPPAHTSGTRFIPLAWTEPSTSCKKSST